MWGVASVLGQGRSSVSPEDASIPSLCVPFAPARPRRVSTTNENYVKLKRLNFRTWDQDVGMQRASAQTCQSVDQQALFTRVLVVRTATVVPPRCWASVLSQKSRILPSGVVEPLVRKWCLMREIRR